jgi:hypothetical protein
MSALGHSLRFDLLSITSDMPSTSDVSGPARHFAKVPKADIASMVLACRMDSLTRSCNGIPHA